MEKKRNGMSESEAGRLGGIIGGKKMKEFKKCNVENYLKDPTCCKYCGKSMPYEKRHNSFCSRKCAASYNNKGKVLNFDTKIKISRALKKNNIKKCKYCGCEKGQCLHPEICQKYRVFKSLEKFGFNPNVIGTISLYEEFLRIKKILLEEYTNHIDDIILKNKYNYTSGLANFHKLLKTMGVEIRPLRERLKETFLLGKKNLINNNLHYKQGWHTTWDGKEVFLRSSYEFDYAKELDRHQIKYEVESLRIKYFDTVQQEYRCSIPDFYLIDRNTIVEIKSEYTLNKKNMKDKFIAYKKLGYNAKLILEHKETDIDLL